MMFTPKPERFNPRNYQPALPLPSGFTKERLLQSFVSLSIDGSATGELTGYATGDCERFIYTLGLVPENAGGRLLEIGANPYFNTLLLRHFRPNLQLSLTNYFGGHSHEAKQLLRFLGFDDVAQEFEAVFQNCNSELERLPFDDQSFDWIVFCEVLEHMTNDPLQVLLELKRVLKKGGRLILTTPNAARLENVVAFLEGRNIYDPYSGYGPYGRHNREYVRHELHELMKHCGFADEVSFTANVHDDIPGRISGAALETMLSAVQHRQHDLGQYLFTRWNNAGTANPKKPTWLYRSYPSDQMA
jgi:SAM-dependent methyltransferase